jgi:hypothetical protein
MQKETKEELIKYIKANEPSFAHTNFNKYSVAQLIIVKAGIDAIMRIAEKKNNK